MRGPQADTKIFQANKQEKKTRNSLTELYKKEVVGLCDWTWLVMDGETHFQATSMARAGGINRNKKHDFRASNSNEIETK